MAVFNRCPGSFEPQTFDGFRRRRSGFRQESAREVTRAHRGSIGKALDGHPLGQVVPYPPDDLGESPALPAEFYEARKLRLAAGAPVVYDQLLRRAPCDLGPDGFF